MFSHFQHKHNHAFSELRYSAVSFCTYSSSLPYFNTYISIPPALMPPAGKMKKMFAEALSE